jgi:hypothetical protein
VRTLIIGLALCGAAIAPAQEQQPQDPRAADQKTQDQKSQGQKTADQRAQDQKSQDNNDQTPPEQSEQNQEETYAGPTILSRDKSLLGERGGKLIDFRYYGEITGVYDSGLTPLVVNPSGQVPQYGAYGAEVSFGVIGTKRWAHDSLSIEYRGTYRNYTNHAYFNGTDQFLDLDYAHLLSRHVTLDFKVIAGRVSLANGAFSFLPLENPDLVAIPTTELFDIPTEFLQSSLSLVWQKTARLSFGVSGMGFLVRRNSISLAGLDGYSGNVNMAYRLSRRQTVSASFGYTGFDYQQIYGNARLQTLNLGYSFGITRKWDFGVQGGATRVTASGLTQVPLDPAIAIIVGQPYTVITSAQVLYVPSFQVRLLRRFDRSSLSFSYMEGVMPGDGIYLTSREEVGSVAYSYVGYRRLALSADASYGKFTALTQTLGQLANFQAGGGGSYRLARSLFLTTRYDYRHYTTQDSFYLKNSNRVTIGLAFSPGPTPLAIF